jgi:iron complex outermembrane receptor protein
MNKVCSLLPLLLASVATAQTPAPTGPAVRTDPVVVQESPLVADAGGTSQVRYDETMPTVARSISGLSSRLANFQINSGGAASYGDILTLRGLSNTPYFSDPSVTLYFDDLPLGSTFAYPTALFGFATATLERGPQGSAFARGGEAGTLTFTSAEPGAQASGELRLGYGNYHARSAAVDVRSARSDSGDVTISAATQQRDGFITNTQLGRTVDDQQVSSAAARLRFRPTKTSELSLQLLGTRHRDGAQPLVPLGGPLFTVARGREGRTNSDFIGGAFKAAFETNAGRLTATTSQTQWKLRPFENRLVLPPTLDSQVLQSQRIWNEEIRLTSTEKSPLHWHVAGWYSEGTTKGNVARGLVLPFATIPIEASSFTLDSRTMAAFGEAQFPVGEFTLTTGLRVERTEREFDRAQTVPSAGRFNDNHSFDAFLPKVSASFPLSSRTTISATIATGTKPGGWSAYTGNAALAGFGMERVVTYELGVESSSADKTLTFAARAFAYTIRNFQIERSFNASDYLVVNAPRARSLGGEVEASWHATRALTLTATFGFTDVRLREFTDPFTKVSYADKRAPYTPDYDWHLGATYRLPSGWFAGAEFTGIGRTHFDESNAAAFTTGSHETVNARAGYSAAKWRVSLYGENLTDENYYSAIIPGVGHGTPGSPKTFGIEAAWKW